MDWYRKQINSSEHLTEAVALGVGIGILLGIFIHVYMSPVVETAHAEIVIKEPPKVVMIEVVSTEETIEAKIRATFPLEPNTAVAVAKSESGKNLNPKAYNPEWHHDKNGNRVCQGSYGLMQVACVHNIDNPEALFDVDFNLKKAKQIYDDAKERKDSPWRPWGGWSSGGYKKYL